MIAETYINHLAKALRIHPNELRARNFYANGQTTHYTQVIEDYTVPRLWSQMLEISQFEKRYAEVQEFNKNNRWRKRGIACVPVKFGMSFTLLMVRTKFEIFENLIYLLL